MGPTFDDRTYEKEVLDPARRLRRAPADLAVRYAVELSRPLDDASLNGDLDRMASYWRRVQSRHRFAEVVATMLVQHKELATELDRRSAPGRRFATFLLIREERVKPLRDRLIAEVRRRTANRRFLTPAEVDWLVDYCEGAFTVATVAAAARAATVAVRDAVTLPPLASYPRLTELRSNVQSLGMALSPELVFGREAVAAGFSVLTGFRLADDRRVTIDLLTSWQHRVDRMGHQEPRTVPTRNVLAILTEAGADPDRLDRLLLAEVAEAVRSKAHGRVEESVLVAIASDLGLVREEAVELAVALAVVVGAGSRASVAERVDEALQDGDLSTAQRLAVQLGTADAEKRLRAEVDRIAAEVTTLTDVADAAVAAGDREAAAVALAGVLELASDGKAADRLRAIAPPPPGSVAAVANGAAVTVRWTASVARVGQIRYRVTRAVEPPPAVDVVTLDGTDDTAVTDRDAPVGARVTYGVAAARGDGAWSAPTFAAPVVVTPEIAEPEILADEHGVEFRWTPWPRMTGVDVTRWEQRPGQGRGLRIRNRLDGFTDTDVHPGTVYFYRLSARYIVSGTLITLPGTTFTAGPEPVPQPVRELGVDVRVDGSNRPTDLEVRVAWTAPIDGTVAVYAGPEQSTYRPGDLIPAQRVGALGVPVPGSPHREPDGRMALVTRLAAGKRHFLTAVTSSGSRAVVGDTAEVTVLAPVTGLCGTRSGHRLKLNWVWPDRVLDARVTWRCDRDAAAVPTLIMCSRAQYRQDSGLTVDVGPDPVAVSVEARVMLPDGPAFSPPAVRRFPAARVRVKYDTAYDGRVLTVSFLADRACELPKTTIVRGLARFLPARADQGEVVQVIGAGTRLVAARTTTVTVPLADARRPWCVVCLADDAAVYLEPRSRPDLWER